MDSPSPRDVRPRDDIPPLRVWRHSHVHPHHSLTHSGPEPALLCYFFIFLLRALRSSLLLLSSSSSQKILYRATLDARSANDQARQLRTHTYREWVNERTGERKSERESEWEREWKSEREIALLLSACPISGVVSRQVWQFVIVHLEVGVIDNKVNRDNKIERRRELQR